MQKPVEVVCPRCGSIVKVYPTDETVRCVNCGKVTEIRGRGKDGIS